MVVLAALTLVLIQQPGTPRPYAMPAVVYPDLLRQVRLEGRVVMRMLVDTSGRAVPESLRVLSSTHAGFDQSAKRAMAAWYFQRPSGRVPVTAEVLFLTTSSTDFNATRHRGFCVHCDELQEKVRERAGDLAACGRVLQRWSVASTSEPLSDTLLSVLQCADAPVIAPLVIRAKGRAWDGDTGQALSIATMGYRFRTADALLAAAQVAEDSTLPAAGRVYGFQVLNVLVHPEWAWRLSPNAKEGCNRILVLSSPPDEWGEPWPDGAEQLACGVAERTLTQRGVPGPVRTAASCLLDLLT